jgi:hypothetical protein
MKAHKLLLAVLAVGVFTLCLMQSTAVAQEGDPPARVAQLNYAQGTVSFQPAGEGDWVTAVPNRPLTTGDNLWVDQNSRAELHTGSTALRLNADTSITFLELTDNAVQIRLSLGSLIVRLVRLGEDETFEVDTPNLAFSLLHQGEYRIDVNDDGTETVTTVWQGQGYALGGGQDYRVVAGQSARFSGSSTLDYDLAQLPPADDFDTWAMQRDQNEDRTESANYVSREMTGYEDLDEYGTWSYVATYGYVWAPRSVAIGWAPYRYGHWAWIAPWGWTWVDDAPWGFAPFHYGRWAQVGAGWFWVPGPIAVRPVYAPALVAFVGGGGFHFSASFGGGPGVAWFPLAPGEVFVPMYHASRVYVNHVNTTNTVVKVARINEVYNHSGANRTANDISVTYLNQHGSGVTAVSQDAFVHARPVARNAVQLSPREIEQAPVAHTLAANPTRSSSIGAASPAIAVPPVPVAHRPVIANRIPFSPAPQPSFSNIESEQIAAGNNGSAMAPAAVNGRQIPRPPQAGETPRNPATAENKLNPQHAATAPESAAHSLVRPAPPAQPKTQQQRNDEEAKNRNWQQQRPVASPRQNVPHTESHESNVKREGNDKNNKR